MLNIILFNSSGCELYRKTIKADDDVSKAISDIMKYVVVYEGDIIRVIPDEK